MQSNDPTSSADSAGRSAIALAGLTEKQAAFCLAYVTENNASKAARDAGYRS